MLVDVVMVVIDVVTVVMARTSGLTVLVHGDLSTTVLEGCCSCGGELMACPLTLLFEVGGCVSVTDVVGVVEKMR